MYAAVIIPEGSAITATPTSADIIVTNLPAGVIGEISPYPIVVIDIVAQYKASKKLLNKFGSIWKMNNADETI
jgi:hypothetical protein